MKPTAKTLILSLLSAANGEPLLVREAIAASALFGISENNVRVALARLSAESLIEGAGRGSYTLGPMAKELSGDIATWRTAEQRLRPWHGDYLAVFSATLGRSDRTALRRRERALQMLGFRELEQGLHIRPNNIEASVEAVRQRLHTLGLEDDARLFVASNFDGVSEALIKALWNGAALTAGYVQLSKQLADWLARSSALDPEFAAREAYLLGSQAIRHVVFDPLLPEPFVDTAARHAFVESVRQFDQAGHRIWRNLNVGQPLATPLPDLPANSRPH